MEAVPLFGEDIDDHLGAAYPDGNGDPDAASVADIVPITDYAHNQEPVWAPITGGKGCVILERSNGPPPVLSLGKSTLLNFCQ